MDYNRVVADLNGYEENKFIKAIKENFEIKKVAKILINLT